MKNKGCRLILSGLIFLMMGLAAPCEERIPDHPDKLVFSELDYVPPDAADHLAMLPGDIPVFIAENHEWPTFDIEVRVLPPEKSPSVFEGPFFYRDRSSPR